MVLSAPCWPGTGSGVGATEEPSDASHLRAGERVDREGDEAQGDEGHEPLPGRGLEQGLQGPVETGGLLGVVLCGGDAEEAADDDEAFGSGHQTPAASAASFFALRQQQQHDQQAIERFPSAAAYTLGGGGAGGSISGASFTSASPVSSQDSHSRMASSVDFQATNFEAQLKASPLFRETMDRLLLCEYTTREIQRDLGDINRKVNLLVERALGISANGNVHPEFQDPFSTNGNISSMNKPRPSMGNIAPNQAANTDDITSISQRLNTLTSSVGQLLALQTQQMQHALPEARNSIISMNPASPMDVAPNQRISPPSIASATSIGHGLPSRPDLRPGARPLNAFMRNQSWSPGNLDLNRRPSEPNLGRPNMGSDKRRASGVSRVPSIWKLCSELAAGPS